MPDWIRNAFSLSIIGIGALILIALGITAGVLFGASWGIIATTVLCAIVALWLGPWIWMSSEYTASWTIPMCVLLVIGLIVGLAIRAFAS